MTPADETTARDRRARRHRRPGRGRPRQPADFTTNPCVESLDIDSCWCISSLGQMASGASASRPGTSIGSFHSVEAELIQDEAGASRRPAPPATVRASAKIRLGLPPAEWAYSWSVRKYV